jgi:hypothetical protein
MRITEILTESQLEQLDEGPMLNKFGAAVGNVAGGVAKGVGAVAGGIAGIGSAFKKGFDRSKGIVGQGGDYVAPDDVPAPPKAGTPAPVKAAAPAAGAAAAPQPQDRIDPTMDEPATKPASTTTPPSAAEINAQGPKGTAPAKAQTGDAGKALAKTTAVVDKQQAASQEKANQTVYAQVKANVDKLDKKGKQRILQLLQKSVTAPQPAASAAPGGAPKAGAGAFGQMVNQLAGQKPNTMANAPVSKTNVAQPGNPNAAAAPATAVPAAAPAAPAAAPATAVPAATKARGGKVAGQVSQTPGAIAKRGKRQAASAASSTGNKVMGNMVNTLQQQNASKINSGNALSETLAQRVETHKQKMFETGLARGTISVFRK